MPSVCAVLLAIRSAAFDELGEKTSHHLLFCVVFWVGVRLEGSVVLGGNVTLRRDVRSPEDVVFCVAVRLGGDVVSEANVTLRRDV